MAKRSLKEGLGGHTSSHTVGPMMGGDGNVAHGYGTLNTRMKPQMQQNGWPYDPEQEIADPADWDQDDPISQKKMHNKTGQGVMVNDPHAKYDQRAMFDDQAVGLAENGAVNESREKIGQFEIDSIIDYVNQIASNMNVEDPEGIGSPKDIVNYIIELEDRSGSLDTIDLSSQDILNIVKYGDSVGWQNMTELGFRKWLRWGVTESVIRQYVRLVMEDVFRMRPGSSGPSTVVNQFGNRIGTGSQFGWSSAPAFDDEESREPAYTFKDIVQKHKERVGELDEDEEVEDF